MDNGPMTRRPTYEELEARVRDLESMLLEDKERFNEIYRNISEFIYEHDGEGTITEISLHFIGQLGYSREELIHRNIREFLPPHGLKLYDGYLKRVHENGRDEGLMKVLARDGTMHIIEYKNMLVNSPGDISRIRGIAKDVTERLETEQALIESDMRFSAVLESIEDGYFEVNLKGDFTFFNNRIQGHLGYSTEELEGKNYREYMDEENARLVFETFHQVFLTGNSVRAVEWELIKKDGTKMYVEASVNLKRNRSGKPCGFQGIIRDSTQRKRSEQRLAYLAYHDALTGLFNRKGFLEQLDETLKEARRFENKRTILYLDLDKFKKVNDLYGHETGDRLLVEVSSRLRKILRDTDYISRLGGDEFTVILGNQAEIQPESVAHRIVRRLSMPYRICGAVIDFVTPSIGISTYPDDGNDLETLLKHADVAMYKAKEQGNRFVRYSNVLIHPSSLMTMQSR